MYWEVYSVFRMGVFLKDCSQGGKLRKKRRSILSQPWAQGRMLISEKEIQSFLFSALLRIGNCSAVSLYRWTSTLISAPSLCV